MNLFIKQRAIKLAKYIIKNKATVRQTAEVFGVSKSTVHYDVSKRLKKINNLLYKKVQVVLANNFNEKHIRGGEATKIKFLNNKN